MEKVQDGGGGGWIRIEEEVEGGVGGEWRMRIKEE